MKESLSKDRRQQTVLFAIISLLVMAVVVLGLYAYKLQNQVDNAWDTSQEKDEKLVLLHQQLDSFQIEFTQRMLQIKQLGGKTESLRLLISQIEQDKQELLRENRFNYKRYAEIKTKLESYIEEMQRRDKEIATLTQENEKLKKQNTDLKHNIAESYKNISQTQQQIDSLKALQENLTTKLRQVERLKIYHIKLLAVNKRGRKREGDRHKARHIEKLLIRFLIAENKAAAQGEHQITIKVRNKNQTTSEQDILHYFTVSKPFAYQGEDKPIEISYENGKQLAKGNYILEIYIDNYIAGFRHLEVY